jgi:hypothetical protein
VATLGRGSDFALSDSLARGDKGQTPCAGRQPHHNSWRDERKKISTVRAKAAAEKTPSSPRLGLIRRIRTDISVVPQSFSTHIPDIYSLCILEHPQTPRKSSRESRECNRTDAKKNPGPIGRFRSPRLHSIDGGLAAHFDRHCLSWSALTSATFRRPCQGLPQAGDASPRSLQRTRRKVKDLDGNPPIVTGRDECFHDRFEVNVAHPGSA